MTAATPIRQSSNNTALVLREDQVEFDERQLAALKQIGVDSAERADLAVFFHQCRRTGLDPFARQIYMIGRREKRNNEWVTKQTIQTGIDGFRLIARRADRNYSYDDTLWCGDDGIWRDMWNGRGKPPYAAKVTVVMGNGRKVSAVAHFAEYAATRSTPQNEIMLTGQWAGKPSVMIAKCAEALALRKAYPQDLSGLYTEDEMEKAEVIEATVVSDQPAPEPSGRDWAKEAGELTSPDAVRELYRECAAFKEMTEELRLTFTDRARALADQPADDKPAEEPPRDEPPAEEPAAQESAQRPRQTRARRNGS